MSTEKQPPKFEVEDAAEAMRKASDLAGRVMRVPKQNVERTDEKAKAKRKRRTA